MGGRRLIWVLPRRAGLSGLWGLWAGVGATRCLGVFVGHGGCSQVGRVVSGSRECRPVLGVFLGLGVSLGLGHASSLGGAGSCGMVLVLGSVPRFGLCCPVFLFWGCCQVGGATETCACDQRRGVSRAARGPLPPGWLAASLPASSPLPWREQEGSVSSCWTKLCLLAQLSASSPASGWLSLRSGFTRVVYLALLLEAAYRCPGTGV